MKLEDLQRILSNIESSGTRFFPQTCSDSLLFLLNTPSSNNFVLVLNSADMDIDPDAGNKLHVKILSQFLYHVYVIAFIWENSSPWQKSFFKDDHSVAAKTQCVLLSLTTP